MQRKRHINFKFWRKAIIESSTSTYSNNIQNKLHDIPTLLSSERKAVNGIAMKSNVKSNVLYSIPCVKSCTHTFCKIKVGICMFSMLMGSIGINLFTTNPTYAAESAGSPGPNDDSGSSSTTAPSATLSLSNINMTSPAITPGSTATVSTNITVSVDNVESYSLILKVDSATLKNGNTTINAGNVVSDNTWGYKWDNASTYTAPTTTGTNLSVPALSNNAVSFTKNLTFGAKFSNGANPGSYKNTGSIMLTATPSSVTLSGIDNMQEMTPEICAASSIGETNTLKDTRDTTNNTYSIRKHEDGKCWMTQNLRIAGSKTLTPADSDVTENYSLLASQASSFNYDCKGNAYYGGNVNYGAYYSFCAAVASNSGSSFYTGEFTSSSVCPKGWKLPSANDYYLLTKAIGASTDAAGNTILRNSTYNFQYAGSISLGSTSTVGKRADYWERSASYDNSGAGVSGGCMFMGSTSNNPFSTTGKGNGGSVRCISYGQTANHTYTITYKQTDGSIYSKESFTVKSVDDTYTFRVYGEADNCSIEGWSGSDGKSYSYGSVITLTASNPSITLTATEVGMCNPSTEDPE